MEAIVYPLSELEDAYIDHHKALGRSAKTWQRHQSTHRLFHKFLAESQIQADSRVFSTDVMRKFSTWLQVTPIERSCRGTNQRSIHGIRGALKDMRALTHWLVEEERLGKEPKIPIPKLPDTLFPILDQTHLEQMWGSKYLSGRSSMATRNRALIGLMLDTGLRRAEVASLTVSSLDLLDCGLIVTGKGRKQRRVPFSSAVKDLLEAWMVIRGTEDGSLFWLQASGIRQVFRAIKDELGLERFHPHMLRHQAATTLVRNNADLESVRRILGHSDISTTVKYLSMTDEDLKAKHAAASPFDSLMRATQPVKPAGRRRLSMKE